MSLNSQNFLAYIAGFLDGDGSIYVRAKPNPTYRYGYQVAPYVAFFQSSSSTKFPEIMQQIGYGKLRLRKDGMYEYTIGKQTELTDFLLKVQPFLQLKSEQAKLMLEILELKQNVSSKNDFSVLLENIEKFRTLNYSKKRITRTMTP